MESRGQIRFCDYSEVKLFNDVYPNGPKKYTDTQRILYTTHLMAEGMHPRKNAVVFAKTELRITSYT